MEPAADPAVTVVFWSKDRGFQLREALASLRRHARFGARPAALRVVVLWRAAAARRAAYARVIEEAEVYRLNSQSFDAFVAACEAAPAPNEALLSAKRRRNKRIENGDLEVRTIR